MTLQSRVSPFGDLFVTPARGTLMGNRGGRLHDKSKQLGARRWASKQWICCRLDFNDRHRKVWSDSYTELFFLDEVTAFAAGHRPCFECRRRDATEFATLFGAGTRVSAGAMDDALHAERLNGASKRVHARPVRDLPDGAMFADRDKALAIKGQHVLSWTPAGYGAPQPRPRDGVVDVLTPPSILAVLARSYRPSWHPSAA